jgi:hypothetical protein
MTALTLKYTAVNPNTMMDEQTSVSPIRQNITMMTAESG